MKPNFARFLQACLRVLIVILLACVFTAWCVSTSKQKGRLSSSPNYDDIVYFSEGAGLLQEARAHGLAGVRTVLNERGLHSPYSIGLASLAFAGLGPDKTSPYYANGLVVLLYLTGVAWLGRRLHPAAWLATLVLSLALPFITMGVVEFRPDIAWAVIAGFGSVFIVTQRELFRHPRRAAVAGLFLALSLLIKPSTFVMTGLLFTGAIISRLWPAWREPGERLAARRSFGGILAFASVVLVVAGPYWFRFGKATWGYFFDNAFGVNKSIWVYPGGLRKSLLYYVNGEGYDSNLGPSGLILVSLIAGAIVYLWIRRPQMRQPMLSLTVLMTGALFVNTLAQMKSPFLGGGIYGVLIFGGFYLIATAWETLAEDKGLRQGAMAAATGLLSVAAITAVFLYQWPRYSHWPASARNANFLNATRFIENLLDQNKTPPLPSVLAMQAGPVVPEIVSLWFSLHGHKANVHNGAFMPNDAAFLRIYPQYEWVVIQEPGVLGNTPHLPVEPQLPRYLELLRADPAYRPIGEYQSPDNRKIWVYTRRPKDPTTAPVQNAKP